MEPVSFLSFGESCVLVFVDVGLLGGNTECIVAVAFVVCCSKNVKKSGKFAEVSIKFGVQSVFFFRSALQTTRMNNQTIIPPTFVLDEYYYSISAILTIGIQLACYAVAATCKFDLITDFAGSTNFVVLSVLTLVLGNNFGSRGIAITVLVLFTRLYLAFFLLFRVCKRKKDARFDEVRGNCIAFLVFWVFQMFWVFLCMMPVLYINSRGQQEDALTPLGYWDYVGWAIFAIGIIIQVTADYQKYFFRKNPENKGQFMATGVWGYSRHPNYFGEILIWWGAFLCAIPVIPFGQGTSGQIAAGIVTILSPLFTMFILILGSGT